MPLAPAQLRDFAARYTAAWCSQNPEAVAAFFSTNGSLKINDAAPSVGRHALAEAARSFMTTFPDLKISMNDLIPRGSRVEYHPGRHQYRPRRHRQASPHHRLRRM